MAELNEFDLAFIVDTTGSMGGLIHAAQAQMVSTIDRLAGLSGIDMQVGVVQYRDHPPQDRLVSQSFPLTSDLKKIQKVINKLSANGGGDGPEAVFAGIVAACETLEWRKHSRRIAVLVGDAPPHGVGAPGDAFARGCPSGETIESTTAKVEEARITLYALGLQAWVENSFTQLSRFTGGEYFRAEEGKAAMEKLEAILQTEFGQLDFDREVFAAWQKQQEPTVDAVAATLSVPPARVAASVSRLRTRSLLTG